MSVREDAVYKSVSASSAGSSFQACWNYGISFALEARTNFTISFMLRVGFTKANNRVLTLWLIAAHIEMVLNHNGIFRCSCYDKWSVAKRAGTLLVFDFDNLPVEQLFYVIL